MQLHLTRSHDDISLEDTGLPYANVTPFTSGLASAIYHWQDTI